MPPKTTKTESKKASAKSAAKHAVASAPKPAVSPVKAVAPRYFEARGGRKTSMSRVRISPKYAGVTINGKDLNQYFTGTDLQQTVMRPLVTMGVDKTMGVSAKVSGGGLNGQAGAISLGIARALILFNASFRKRLRAEDLLTRDSRMVERKKYGLKKARRAPQWAKR